MEVLSEYYTQMISSIDTSAYIKKKISDEKCLELILSLPENIQNLLSDNCQKQTYVSVYADNLSSPAATVLYTGCILKQYLDIRAVVDNFSDGHKTVPEKALQEALLNIFMHRDYQADVPAQINLSPKKCEFLNIGELMPPLSVDILGNGFSIQQNKELATLFLSLGLTDSFGSGIRRIKAEYDKQKVSPIISCQDGLFSVILPSCEEVNEINKEANSNLYKKNIRKEQILEYCREHGNITRRDIEDLVSVSRPMASIIVKTLVQDGILKSVGSGRNTVYTAVSE